MLFEDRLETAERRRRDGNSLFQAGSFVDALGKYAMALSYMDQDFMYQLQGPHEQLANAVRVPVLLNMAACHLHLQDYQGAIDVTSQVNPPAFPLDCLHALTYRPRPQCIYVTLCVLCGA